MLRLRRPAQGQHQPRGRRPHRGHLTRRPRRHAARHCGHRTGHRGLSARTRCLPPGPAAACWISLHTARPWPTGNELDGPPPSQARPLRPGTRLAAERREEVAACLPVHAWPGKPAQDQRGRLRGLRPRGAGRCPLRRQPARRGDGRAGRLRESTAGRSQIASAGRRRGLVAVQRRPRGKPPNVVVVISPDWPSTLTSAAGSTPRSSARSASTSPTSFWPTDVPHRDLPRPERGGGTPAVARRRDRTSRPGADGACRACGTRTLPGRILAAALAAEGGRRLPLVGTEMTLSCGGIRPVGGQRSR